MDRKRCLCVILGWFLFLDMIETVVSCGGDNDFAEIEMCDERARSTEPVLNFHLHASPTGNVERCDCNLTMTGDGGLVTFTIVTLSPTCGGTVTVPGGSTRNCTTTVYEHNCVPHGTYVVSFTFNTANVSKCLKVQTRTPASTIRTVCIGTHRTTTTNVAYSGEPVSENTPTSAFTTGSSLNVKQDTSRPVVEIAGGVGGGLLMLLVVVAVVTVCSRGLSSDPENITIHELQDLAKRPSEPAHGQVVTTTSSGDNYDTVQVLTDPSTNSLPHGCASSSSYTNDHLGRQNLLSTPRDNYNTVTFNLRADPSQHIVSYTCCSQKGDRHSYEHIRRISQRPKSCTDNDTGTLPTSHNEVPGRDIESMNTNNYSCLRRASQRPESGVEYDTMASAAMFLDDMQSVYSYDHLKTRTGTARDIGAVV
ncbi:uncharacterized protein [Haliotis cracherodii]|uniref:uncharacterized protein n=1 Tax=Haliotis cracherodii TaxID=6455 RepID=UPI0039EB8E6C